MVRLSRVDSVGHFDAKKTTRHSIYSIDFQPFGGRLATAGGDSTVKLWNTEYLPSDPDAKNRPSLDHLTTLTDFEWVDKVARRESLIDWD